MPDGSMTQRRVPCQASLVTCHCPCHLPAGAPARFFLTLGLREPRGSVRLGLGGRFFRASRFNFLRSALSSIFLVFIVKGPQESAENAPGPARRAQLAGSSERPVARLQTFSRGANFSMSFLVP